MRIVAPITTFLQHKFWLIFGFKAQLCGFGGGAPPKKAQIFSDSLGLAYWLPKARFMHNLKTADPGLHYGYCNAFIFLRKLAKYDVRVVDLLNFTAAYKGAITATFKWARAASKRSMVALTGVNHCIAHAHFGSWSISHHRVCAKHRAAKQRARTRPRSPPACTQHSHSMPYYVQQ